MSHLLLTRPARVPGPPRPDGPIAVSAPPQLPPAAGAGSWFTYLFPVIGSAGSLVFILVNPSPVYIIGGILFALGSLGMGVGLYFSQRSGRRGQLGETRRRYLRYLDRLRGELRETVAAQQAAAAWAHPAPAALPATVLGTRRLWERRRGDPDFLTVRVGLGDAPLARPLSVPAVDEAVSEPEPVAGAALARLLTAFAVVPDQPVTIALADTEVVSLVGDRGQARAAARALLCQLAAFHAPDDVRVAVCAGPAARAAWGWVKWLPHAQHPEAADSTGPLRMIASSPDGLAALLGAELDSRRRWRRAAAQGSRSMVAPGPHLVVVLDDTAATPGETSALDDIADLGVSVLHVLASDAGEPSRVDLRLSAAVGRLSLDPLDGSQPRLAVADAVSLAEAEAWARRLAPLRLSAQAPERALVDTLGLPELVGVADVGALDPAAGWRGRPRHAQLRVPLGVDPAGVPVELDLKESAAGGMGPHGLIVGATGSGKSELLRTLVTGLALTHPPEQLAFVLVDFKGGATFAGMAGLPHVAGIITNLQDDLAMVDRFHAALYGELSRRQEALQAAGSLVSIHEYAAHRAQGADLEPLPSLLVIVDEFSELLATKPDFIDLFVAIGRLGRSLGVHLLLASQRLDEGRLRGLESHLSYRIGLRTFSAAESRTVLGVPDAYELPPVPGSAYLKIDVSGLQRLRAAMVSAPYRAPSDQPVAAPVPAAFRAEASTDAPVAAPAFEPDADAVGAPSVMDVVVDRLAGAAPRAHQVWLPPLPGELSLDRVLGPLRVDSERGLHADNQAPLTVAIGLVDRPSEQRQDPFALDLAGANGHVVVVGGPQSGKSTALRTLVLGLCLTHTPAEVAVYALDFGGGLLATLSGAPHVGAVASRLDPERVRRVVAEVHAVLEHREGYFASAGIDAVATFRARRAAGALPDEELGDVFLVVDGWATVRADFEDLEPLLADIAAKGLAYGVHLVLAASRWMDVRTAVRDHLGTRVELRLGEPGDSVVDRKAAAQLSAQGRCLVPGPLQVQLALPQLETGIDGRPASLAELAARLAAAWPHAAARPVRLLPLELPYADLPAPGRDLQPGVPIGVGEPELAPTYVDLATGEPHLLVLGDGQSGKTSVLRNYLAGLAARRSPDEAKIVMIDYRRTLLGAVPTGHLLDYAGAAPAAADQVAEVAAVLTRRLPGPDVTPAQLRDRSWWTGPEVYLVVDDYDLVVTPTGNPLTSLLDVLPQAADVGLHLILTRRVAGMARGAYEPVLARLRELGVTGLILSGDPMEGALLGPVRAGLQPPGRGLLVRGRQRPVLVQTAWLPPPDLAEPE